MRQFRDRVEELRLDEVMHPVAELEAWHACCTGRAKLSPEQLDEISRLFAPGTPGSRLGMDNQDRPAMRQACQDSMIRWQKYYVAAPPNEAKVARTVRRTYQLLWKELGERKEQHMSSWELGIDFGTSYTVVAVAQDGNVRDSRRGVERAIASAVVCFLVARRNDPRRDCGPTPGGVRPRALRANTEEGARRRRAVLGRPHNSGERACRRGAPARLHRSLQAARGDDSGCGAHNSSGGLERSA